MKKREFIRKISLLSASAAIMPTLGTESFNYVSGAESPQNKTLGYSEDRHGKEQDVSNVRLRDKFFGCIAGCHIGSAMGAPVEGNSWERIEKEYGTLDKLLPYHHYGNSNDWMREPGTTEDGVERQKLMITAIIEKQDRINAEDLRRCLG